jgi:hypothetical protein
MKKTAADIIKGIPLSNSATDEDYFKWAENMCSELESKFDDHMIKQIRMGCACGPTQDHMEKLRQLFFATKNVEEFARKYNMGNYGSTIQLEGETIYFSYPACYCSLVNKIDRPISKTFCYCSLGYAKKMFEYALGHKVNVELLESIKTGGSKCLMRIERV